MTTEISASHSKQVKVALMKIGANLILFQEIEAGLKIVLPYIHPNGSHTSEDAFVDLKNWVKDKSLGQVMGKVAESVTLRTDDELALWLADLKRMVDSRNELVHHLLNESRLFNTEAGCQNLIEFLDNQKIIADKFHGLMKIHIEALIMLFDEAEKLLKQD